MSAMKVVRLDGTWAAKITEMRAAAYEKFGNDLKNSAALQFGPSDIWNANIAVIEGDELLSLLRLEKHRTEKTLRFSLQTSVSPLEYPAAVLSRAATIGRAERQNFHMLLRLVALRALVQAGYREVYGTFRVSSKRSAFLKSLGYNLIEESSEWSDFLQTNQRTYRAVLDLKSEGHRAITMLEKMLVTDTDQGRQTKASKLYAEDAGPVQSLVDDLVVFLRAN
ncbi:hypothetical protein BH10BDE1_BH10BDE1_27360 [soil metagenome]